MHGAAGRVGTAVLELAALAGLRVYGTASARDRAAVERLGGVAIDYRNEDFLARVRELTGDGVDIALDPFGGALSLRSFRALRPGGRLVIYGRQNTIAHGRKNWPAVFEWYAGDRTRRAVGIALAAPAGARLPDPEAAPPPPGLVPGGLRRAARAAPRGQDPPGRGRAPAAVRRASRARAAREHGGRRETRARAIADEGHSPMGALPAHRRARHDRRPAHRRVGRHGRDHRLVLLPAVRLAECVRRDPRRRPRGCVPHFARVRQLEFKAALPTRHQHPDHALPHARRGGGGAGLHAPG